MICKHSVPNRVEDVCVVGAHGRWELLPTWGNSCQADEYTLAHRTF